MGGKARGDGPEMEQEPKQQWEADLLQDSCSLSGACSQRICGSFFFSCISHYLVPRDQQQAEGQCFMWQEAEVHAQKSM